MNHTNPVSLRDVCTKTEYISHSLPDKKLTKSKILI